MPRGLLLSRPHEVIAGHLPDDVAGQGHSACCPFLIGIQLCLFMFAQHYSDLQIQATFVRPSETTLGSIEMDRLSLLVTVASKMKRYRVDPLRHHGATDDPSGDRGRRVVCAEPNGIREGDLALRAAPLASLLDPTLWTSHCHSCFQVARAHQSLSRCGRCRAVYYCSRSCQQRDWKPDHHAECTRLQQLLSLKLRADQVSDVVLLGRVMRRLNHAGAIADGLFIESPMALVWNDADGDQETELLAVLSQKLGFAAVDETAKSLRNLQRMLSRFRNNNMAICDARLLPLGVGCIPLGAMVNHSCDPNCVVTYAPSTHAMEFHAIRPIAHGEEITLAYLDIALPRVERVARLQRRYHFNCTCARCASPLIESKDRYLDADVNGAAPSDWPEETRSRVLESMELVAKANEGTDAEAQRALILEALAMQELVLHRYNIQLLSTLASLFTLQVESQQDLEEALATGERMLDVYTYVYPANHPIVGLHLYTLGDLCAALEKNEEARHKLTNAARILSITHGTSDEFVRILQEQIAHL